MSWKTKSKSRAAKLYRKTGLIAMAVAHGKQSTEGMEIKRYVGIAPVFVRAVNPNKAQLESFGINVKEEPVYVAMQEVNGKQIPTARLTFVLQTDEEKCGIALTTLMTLFIRQAYNIGSKSGKYQILDEYGRTAWATEAEIKSKAIPQYANGPASIADNYRPSLVGEEDLCKFLIAFLNLDNVTKFVDGKPAGLIDHPENSACRLDHINDMFKNNFSEIKEIIKYQPDNKFKVLLGVRTNDENRQYQAVYTQMFLKNSVTDYSKIDKDVKERIANGAYATTTFTCDGNKSAIGEIEEYVVKSTDFGTDTTVADGAFPFATLPEGGGMPFDM